MNKMPVNNKFALLLGQKSMTEKRRIPLTEIAKETGISYPTLLAWSSNNVTRYDVSVIDSLARYFHVKDIGELLEYVEGPATNNKKSARK
jgi:hypothetical protein